MAVIAAITNDLAALDIHGNLPALEAVLREVRTAAADVIVVGGDVARPDADRVARPAYGARCASAVSVGQQRPRDAGRR